MDINFIRIINKDLNLKLYVKCNSCVPKEIPSYATINRSHGCFKDIKYLKLFKDIQKLDIDKTFY